MRELILGTAGHIDHGKTALVRALTGVDTDRLQQEKERGISIDIGFAQLDVEGARLGIVDVPGHERFIRNMLAGACGVDVAMLVVAADDSVMPQTREHMAILQLLRIRHGLVVLTKTDLVEPSWLELVEDDIRELVAGTFLEDAPIVRTSAQAGTGLDDLKAALGTVCGSCRPERQDGFFRMAVDRAFVLQGLGTVVTGSVWAGSIDAGADVDWVQPGRTLRVRSVQSHGQDAEAARRGQRAALNLSGARHSDIERGHVIAERGYMSGSSLLTVRIDVLPGSPWPVRHRSRLRLHVGSQETHAEVRLLHGTTISPGESGLAQLRCSDPVACVARQPFVLRTESPVRTIGGGAVLQPVARPVSRRDADVIATLPGLLDDDPATRASVAAAFLPSDWTLPQLCRDADLAPDDAAGMAARLELDGVIVTVPVSSRRSIRIHRDELERVEARVIEAMRRLHAAEPMVATIPCERLVSQLDYVDRDVVRGVLGRLLSVGRISGDDASVALPDHAPALTEQQRRIRDGVLEACRAAVFRPPSAAELAAAVATREDRVEPIIALCVAERELAHVGAGLYLHASWEEELRRRMVQHLTGSEGMTVSQIKDVLETSRKYAVPICEYLDRIGLTRRFADKRALATA